MPPGPFGLPIIGNLLQLGRKPHESLAKLSQKHGPLMTSVVASTPDAAREIFQFSDVACSGRFIRDSVTSWTKHDSALIWMIPNQERRTMRYAFKTYRTIKHKLDTLGDLRENVVEGMLEFLRKNNEAVDIGKFAFAVALNKMSNTCLSHNVTSYESDDISGFKTAIKTLMEVDGKFNIADIFPVLKPIDPQNIRRQAKTAYAWLDKVIEGFVYTRLKHRESKLPRFDDMFDSLTDYSQDNDVNFKLKNAQTLLTVMFIGGTETSSNTTEWAMAELLREEIFTTVGKDGKIHEAKILGFPYLRAVIKETTQFHFPVPLLVPHKTETKVSCQKTPKFW